MIRSISHDFSSLFYMARHFYEHGKIYFVVHFFIGLIVSPLSTVLNIYMQKIIIDRISDGEVWLSIFILILVFHIVYLCINLIEELFYIHSAPLHDQVVEKLDKMVFQKAISSDLENFNKPRYLDDYTWTIDNFSGQSDNAKCLLLDFFSHIVSVTAIIAIIISLDYLVLVFVLAHIITSFFIKRFRIGHNYNLNVDLLKTTRVFNYIKRIFYDPQNSIELKSNRSSKLLLNKYDETIIDRKKVRKKYAAIFSFFSSLNAINVVVFNFVLVSFLVYRIVNGDLSIGSFVALTSSSLILSNILGNIMGIFNQVHELKLFADKVKNFMTAKSNIESNSNKSNAKTISSNPFSIKLNNVEFRYEAHKKCLYNINMTIKKGERIAIVGENGAGKSTLVKLLMRLYDVNDGEILINDMPINTFDVKEFRSKIGVIYQKPFIFALSLMDNMQLYKKSNEGSIIKALNDVGLNQMLIENEKMLESDMSKEFSEDGIVLSGGNEQKLCIARLLIGGFNLLIFDEPSSSLDPLIEYELNELIYKYGEGSTIIMISHRLSNVRNADRIFVMDSGTISESGTHDELMILNRKYSEMFKKQASGYTD